MLLVRGRAQELIDQVPPAVRREIVEALFHHQLVVLGVEEARQRAVTHEILPRVRFAQDTERPQVGLVDALVAGRLEPVERLITGLELLAGNELNRRNGQRKTPDRSDLIGELGDLSGEDLRRRRGCGGGASPVAVEVVVVE